MLKITKPSANRIDLELNGEINAIIMRKGLDDLIAQSQDVTNGTMLYTITDFSMPTLGAMAVEMARIPQLFGLLAKFDKCAVLSDSGWLRTAANVEGALFPGIEIKGFEIGELAKAEAWLANQSA